MDIAARILSTGRALQAIRWIPLGTCSSPDQPVVWKAPQRLSLTEVSDDLGRAVVVSSDVLAVVDLAGRQGPVRQEWFQAPEQISAIHLLEVTFLSKGC